MRIAQACFRFGAPGGAEDHVLQISRELVRRGHEVVVHASDIYSETPWVRGAWTQGSGCRVQGAGTGTDPGSAEHRSATLNPEPRTLNPRVTIDGIEVVRHRAWQRPFSEGFFSLVIPGMLGGLLRERCDLVHAHSHRYFQLEAAASAARARGLPLHVTPHYHPAEAREGLRNRALLRLYDLYSAGAVYRHARRVLTVTEREKDHIAPFVPGGKCHTVGNGIDPMEWEGASERDFRRHSGMDGPYILYSGRLASNKGLGHLFDAMPSILKGFDGGLVVLGKDWGMKPALIDKARRNDFAGRVRFIDYLPDRALYRSAVAGCELLVLPSEWEAFGIVLLEAAMCRRPVVATSVGGVPEVVGHGKTGFLVPYGNPGALAEAVTGLLSDAGLRARMGEEGRRQALDKHTWRHVVDRILQAYSAG